jgi:predicted molibdopterin-dependent oxidoreductase YjgC
MRLRIRDAAVQRPEQVTITVDGAPIAAWPGEMLASALLAASIRVFRRSPRAGTPRAPFCLMGACQECLVTCDGARVVACQEPVRAGMRVSLAAGP